MQSTLLGHVYGQALDNDPLSRQLHFGNEASRVADCDSVLKDSEVSVQHDWKDRLATSICPLMPSRLEGVRENCHPVCCCDGLQLLQRDWEATPTSWQSLMLGKLTLGKIMLGKIMLDILAEEHVSNIMSEIDRYLPLHAL